MYVCSALTFFDSLGVDVWAMWHEDELNDVQRMLRGERKLKLERASTRWFFGLFHVAHIHVYEEDMPEDSDAASSVSVTSSRSACSTDKPAQTGGAGGLYVAQPSDTGVMQGDSTVEHERAQAEAPRILIAQTIARRSRGSRRTRVYAPLLPMPTTLTAGDLHPLNTAMHSIKIPFALLTSEKAVNDLFYLQPRYSQHRTQPSGGTASSNMA